MKKVIFSLLAVMALVFVANNSQAQTTPALKVGVFDMDIIVARLPEYKNVQAKLEEYQRDSLGTKRDELEFQYNRLDSMYKADSLAKKPKSVLDYSNKQRQQFAWQLYNWQNIVQNASRQKFSELSQPLYEKVNKAYLDAVKAAKVTLVIKPDAVMFVDDKVVVNLFEPVAKTLGIDLNAKDSTDANGAPGGGN
ncbi:MAG TPA: OmpH family outer membrane protein [Arachidicoccus sp.]|nr:OmpH family outer membrane protein [Arachidicoccus sp.]